MVMVPAKPEPTTTRSYWVPEEVEENRFVSAAAMLPVVLVQLGQLKKSQTVGSAPSYPLISRLAMVNPSSRSWTPASVLHMAHSVLTNHTFTLDILSPMQQTFSALPRKALQSRCLS